ncbi:MAG TPA: glycosyl hydrolase family 65 protein [Streptosporangiaceae bacterium]|nr:glycosyl hydrolase family 65 protein [Streptosporangiaceae bacterium]
MVEPWAVRETWLDTDPVRLAQAESVFALANGHIGWRANLDEGEPHGMPGSYLNGVHEDRPLPWAEPAYGYPESGETMINVTNGKIIRLLVDDEPFGIRYGTLRSHERVLDFRAGTLDRRAEWRSPAGSTVRVTSRRLVSFTQRAIAAIRYEVEPLDRPARIVVQSELAANEQLPALDGDPRFPELAEAPLRHELDEARDGSAILIHRTRTSRFRVAAAMDHLWDCPAGVRHQAESHHDLARLTLSTLLRPGQRLSVVKLVGYGWSGVRSRPAVQDQVEGALAAALRTGWEGLLAEQREYLDEFWGRADVEISGDEEVQQAVRFALFHVLQAGARAEGQAIPAKGLTGPGHDGHAFWDTEMFVLPVLTHTVPDAAAAALRWRHATLGRAQDRARELRLDGAAFPWRTISGRECSGYWPTGTAAFHVNAGVADAVINYTDSTGDAGFDAGPGLDLLVNTARLWRSLGHYDSGGAFRIDGVTGPDEYSALADNNVYTNLMAQRNLRAAAAAVRRHAERAAAGLGAGEPDARSWLAAAEAMVVPFDEKLGVHPQAEGFTGHQEWDFAAMTGDDYPLLLHYPYFDLYRRQVIKQADLVLAMQRCPEAFTPEQKARNFAYYEQRTVRDSSLSACTQAVIAAEAGHLDLAYDYLAETALIDLDDLRVDTRTGLHVAALAGSWFAVVQGLGGMRRIGGVLGFAPRLAGPLTRLAFSVTERGRVLRVEIGPGQATYQLTRDGEPLGIRHYGQPVTVTASGQQARPIPPAPVLPRPSQPPGREPARRRAGSG